MGKRQNQERQPQQELKVDYAWLHGFIDYIQNTHRLEPLVEDEVALELKLTLQAWWLNGQPFTVSFQATDTRTDIPKFQIPVDGDMPYENAAGFMMLQVIAAWFNSIETPYRSLTEFLSSDECKEEMPEEFARMFNEKWAILYDLSVTFAKKLKKQNFAETDLGINKKLLKRIQTVNKHLLSTAESKQFFERLEVTLADRLVLDHLHAKTMKLEYSLAGIEDAVTLIYQPTQENLHELKKFAAGLIILPDGVAEDLYTKILAFQILQIEGVIGYGLGENGAAAIDEDEFENLFAGSSVTSEIFRQFVAVCEEALLRLSLAEQLFLQNRQNQIDAMKERMSNSLSANVMMY